MQKLTYLLMALIVMASMAITLSLSPPFTFTTFINTLFMSALLITVVGASLYIIQSGTFYPFIKSVKYFIQQMNKTKHIADQIERKQMEKMTRKRKIPLTIPCLVAGNIMLAIAIFFSFL